MRIQLRHCALKHTSSFDISNSVSGLILKLHSPLLIPSLQFLQREMTCSRLHHQKLSICNLELFLARSWLSVESQAPFKINDFRQALSNEGNNPDCVRQDITLTHPAADSLCLSAGEVSTQSAEQQPSRSLLHSLTNKICSTVWNGLHLAKPFLQNRSDNAMYSVYLLFFFS